MRSADSCQKRARRRAVEIAEHRVRTAARDVGVLTNLLCRWKGAGYASEHRRWASHGASRGSQTASHMTEKASHLNEMASRFSWWRHTPSVAAVWSGPRLANERSN